MIGSLAKARSRLWNIPTDSIRQVPFWALLVGTFFFVGLSPVSSGTVGSAVAAILYYTIPSLQINWILAAFCLICLVAGAIASNVIVTHTKEHDAGIIVIDEVLGQWLALITFWYAGDLIFIVVAFVLFRLFDILKVYPASRFERSVGGTSIMLDDVVAGIYANIGAHIITYAYYRYMS
jgi:phosphatidylglycerophosphatase A